MPKFQSGRARIARQAFLLSSACALAIAISAGHARAQSIETVTVTGEKYALEKAIDSEQSFGRAVWGVLSLELWHQTFIDESSREQKAKVA